MKIWLPYVIGGSGTDTFTESFAEHLARRGHTAVTQAFPHWMQYFPDLLKKVRPPDGADVALTNTWNGFAFKKNGLPMVTMEQLCVLDPAYSPFRNRRQALFHSTLVRWSEARTFAASDRVVAVSQATREALVQQFDGVDPVVIPNGVDVDFFTPALSEGIGDEFRLLFVGNLTKRKGSDLLPSIMATLGPGFHLSYTTGLRGGAVLDAVNSVALGTMNRDGVRRAYRQADALIFPTRLEGLPLAVLEAMACGLPVVGSDRSSMPEAVVHGETGFLCPLTPNSFVSAIHMLAEDRAMHGRMSEAARLRAENEFSLELTVRRYLEIFRSLVD